MTKISHEVTDNADVYCIWCLCEVYTWRWFILYIYRAMVESYMFYCRLQSTKTFTLKYVIILCIIHMIYKYFLYYWDKWCVCWHELEGLERLINNVCTIFIICFDWMGLFNKNNSMSIAQLLAMWQKQYLLSSWIEYFSTANQSLIFQRPFIINRKADVGGGGGGVRAFLRWLPPSAMWALQEDNTTWKLLYL